MNFNFKNDLENNVVILTFNVPKRSTMAEPRIKLSWSDIEKLIGDHYSPPKGYSLGSCTNSHKKIDNDIDSRCQTDFIINLIKENTKEPIKTLKTKKKSKDQKKKTNTSKEG